MKKIITALVLMGCAGNALAAPAFGRPGTAFNPEVLEPGSVAWEQGLPDVTRNKADGITETLYQYDTHLRFGITPHLELQLLGNPYNQYRVSGHGNADSVDGPGNTGVAVKVNLPTQSELTHVGVLASLDFNTGKPAFRDYDSDGKEARSAYLGVTVSRDLDADQAITGYLDVTHTHDDDVYTFSPSWSTALSDDWGAYLEYKVSFGDIEDNDQLAGGGFTWLVTDRLQLDIYSDFGLTSDSTDYESGFGFAYLVR